MPKLSDYDDNPIEISKKLDSYRKISSQSQSINPSEVVTLFEIDLEDLIEDQNLPVASNQRIFRFHSNVKLLRQRIRWRGEEYISMPIMVTGFESTTRGTAPSPRMVFRANEEDIKEFRDIKVMMRQLDDLCGAKVTRVRTFAKYLDKENFNKGDQDMPEGFEPDPHAEFPREIFFVERKTSESSTEVEFELSSFVDFENKQLPSRVIITRSCQWQYRGEGCLYEFSHLFNPNDSKDRKTSEKAFGTDNIRSLSLPPIAHPIATDEDILITELVPDYIGRVHQTPKKYQLGTEYPSGDWVYIEKNGVKYYFVARQVVPANLSPPHVEYWLQDACSKSQRGCKLRWNDAYRKDIAKFPRTEPINGADGTHYGCLPFGGFPAVKKIEEG
jgi:lambda family phage minor tail protein L